MLIILFNVCFHGRDPSLQQNLVFQLHSFACAVQASVGNLCMNHVWEDHEYWFVCGEIA